MSAFHAALGGMVTAAGVGMVMVGRTWPTPSGLRRSRLVSDESLLDELLGPPPEPAPHAAVVQAGRSPRRSLRRLAVLQELVPLTADGWRCGECLKPANHVTTHTPGSAL